MGHDIDELRAEVAELRAELAVLQPRRDAAVTRRRMLTGLAALGAAGAAGVASAGPAAAADGEPVVLGADNTTTVGLRIKRDGTAPLPPEGVGSIGVLTVQEGSNGTGIYVRSGGRGLVANGWYEGVRGTGLQGVVGKSDGLVAVWAVGSDDANGVIASSQNAPAMSSQSAGGVQLLLVASSQSGAPTGNWLNEVGSISVDQDGDVWLCVVEGNPGTWTRLLREDNDSSGRVVPVPPIRVIDTRATGGRPAGSPAVPGQKKGPLKGGMSLTLDLAGAGIIPATASGVVGNLTVVNPTYAGYLVARPSGAATTTSSINFPAAVSALANAFTSQLGPAGLTILGSGGSANTYQLVVDITAYVT